MTTHVQRPTTVTAHIDTPAPPAAPPASATQARDAFTVTVSMNVEDHSFFGYHPGHHVAEVTATPADTTPLRLTFTTAATHTDAAEAAFAVGNGQGSDERGQTWPSDVRSVSVGDVLAVTAPDDTTVHLSVDPTGYSEIDPPRTIVPLAGTTATSRTR